MILQHKSVDSLIPYARNSRTHSEQQIDQIAASIKQFGFLNPIIVDGDNGVLAGHGRLLAANKIGLVWVPTIDASHLDDAQKRAFIIADNKITLNGGWDEEILKNEISGLLSVDFDLSLLGFSSDELESLIETTQIGIDGLTDPDDIPETPTIPVSVLGDIWLMGDHRLMCGDSTNSESVKQLVGGALVDMLLTDPPYNVAYNGKTKDRLTIMNDSMKDELFRQFLSSSFSAANNVLKAGAVFYIWHADREGYNFRVACRDVGWDVRQCIIWNKNSMVLGRQDYHCKHEPCLYGWKSGASHLWASDRKQTTVLNFEKTQKNDVHPTMKPVSLFEYQILNNTKGGDIVLDLFGGSGTTLIAAEKNGRQSRLMELDTKYCDVIIKRWQDFSGKQGILERTGRKFDEVSHERAA
jgi:site-specific DNA-methyltransferase (adenine-specific)